MSAYIHYDMMVEWGANPDRYIVESYMESTRKWIDIGLPTWNPEQKYRLVERRRKIKRWIAVYPDGNVLPQHFATKQCILDKGNFLLKGTQFIEIEVSVPWEADL